MKILIGTKNQTKLTAVKETLKLYPELFPNADIEGVDVKIEIFGHPKSLEETVKGAIERAKQAFSDCEYSIGLESGLTKVPESKSGYMEIAVCAIYDGKNISLGTTCGFEWPKKVTELILKGEADGSQAFKQLGLTEHEKLGAVEGGIIGFLTKNRITREDQTKQSLIMALIHLEHPELY